MIVLAWASLNVIYISAQATLILAWTSLMCFDTCPGNGNSCLGKSYMCFDTCPGNIYSNVNSCPGRFQCHLTPALAITGNIKDGKGYKFVTTSDTTKSK